MSNLTPFPSQRALLACFLAALFIGISNVNAATSYLMLQGKFDGVNVQTYRWSVTYDTGALLTGRDLLSAVFGTAVPDPDPDVDSFTSSQGGFSTEFLFNNDFLYSVTNPSNQTLTENFYNQGWAGYAANGGYSYEAQRYEQDGDGNWVPVFDGNGDPVIDTYSDAYTASWTSSGSGPTGRNLLDGSFDAFIFGEYNPLTYSPISTLTGTPSVADFSGTVLNTWTGSTAGGSYTVRLLGAASAVPEPGKTVYLMFGVACLLFRRKRR